MNDLEHRTANPQRPALYWAISEILVRGYTLTAGDIQEFMPNYGYSPKYSPYEIIDTHVAKTALEAFGVQLVNERYKNMAIFLDGNIDPENTDVEETKRRIDEKLKPLRLRTPKEPQLALF